MSQEREASILNVSFDLVFSQASVVFLFEKFLLENDLFGVCMLVPTSISISRSPLNGFPKNFTKFWLPWAAMFIS